MRRKAPGKPREGETRPRLRIPEFQDAGEWIPCKLVGDAAGFFNGRAYKKEELLSEGKYRVLCVGNFFSNAEWRLSDLEIEALRTHKRGLMQQLFPLQEDAEA